MHGSAALKLIKDLHSLLRNGQLLVCGNHMNLDWAAVWADLACSAHAGLISIIVHLNAKALQHQQPLSRAQ